LSKDKLKQIDKLPSLPYEENQENDIIHTEKDKTDTHFKDSSDPPTLF